MPKIIWFNRPTNHSGYLNLLYLSPEGEVDQESTYTDWLTGYFIMGGPALLEEYDQMTEAGKKLLAFLDPGFHFYPPESEEKIRQEVDAKKEEIPANLRYLRDLFDDLAVFSKDYRLSECLQMLVRGEEPTAPVVLVDLDWERIEQAFGPLCRRLADIFYHLPKEKREELNLKRDWHIPSG